MSNITAEKYRPHEINCHRSLSHSGIYNVFTELRKKYWLPCSFSIVKAVLINYIHCKRSNARGIKLNQGGYSDFRLYPNNVPFSYIVLHYAVPYKTRDQDTVKKVCILVITCLYSVHPCCLLDCVHGPYNKRVFTLISVALSWAGCAQICIVWQGSSISSLFVRPP